MTTLKACLLVVLGTTMILRIIVDVWPRLVPGSYGAKIAADADRELGRHPITYWAMRTSVVAIGVWLIVMGAVAISN